MAFVFKQFKKKQYSEFDALMQIYLDKYVEYIDSMMHAMTTRLALQYKFLLRSGTLIQNIN